MKKTLLIPAIALLASALSTQAAQMGDSESGNLALHKWHQPYVSTDQIVHPDTRFIVGPEAAGITTFPHPDAAYSVGFWVKRDYNSAAPTNCKSSTVLASFSTVAHENFNGAWLIEADTEGTITLDGWGLQSAGAAGSVADFTLENGKWYFMLVTHDQVARKFRLYIDGDLLYDKDLTATIDYNPSDQDGDGLNDADVFQFAGFGFNGAIDNIQFYNRALDQDEALVAFYAPHKLTSEITALYDFQDPADFTKNAVGTNSFGAQYQMYYAGHIAYNDGLTGEKVEKSTTIPEAQGAITPGESRYGTLPIANVADSLCTGYDIPEIPQFNNITIPDLGTYEHAKVEIRDHNGNILVAGDPITYELGDKFTITVTGDPETDWIITSIERLGRTLNPTDHFYSAYDLRDWRDITIATAQRYVAMTVENPNGLEYTVTYADGTDADPNRLEYGKQIKVTVVSGEYTLRQFLLNGTELTGTADGVFTFARPETDFTVTLASEISGAYKLLIARTEGVTITVTDIDGNTIPSGSYVDEGQELTITATSADGSPVTLKVNGAEITSGSTHTVTADVTVTGILNPTLAADYCTVPGNATDTRNRQIAYLTLTDGTNTTAIGSATKPLQSSATHALYFDKTSSSLTTTPGATLTLSVKGNNKINWMSHYVYIDLNRDGEFTVDQSLETANGEMVALTGYNTKAKADNSDTADPVDENGNRYSDTKWDDVVANFPIPSFTLPADLQPGTYRIRYKLDWNSTNPCGRIDASSLYGNQKGNYMADNGGSIIDFSIVIPEPEVFELTTASSGDGHVEIWSDIDADGHGTGIRYESGEGLFLDQPLHVFFIANEDRAVNEATITNAETAEAVTTDGTANTISVVGNVDIKAVFSTSSTAIDAVTADQIDFNAPVEYFNIQGIRVNPDSLSTGIYIVRQGKKAAKLLITK